MELEDLAFLGMILAAAFFISMLIRSMTNGEIDAFKALRKGSCPPHFWKKDGSGKTYCDRCPFKPGDNHAK